MAKDKLICNCNRTMPLDGRRSRARSSSTPLRMSTSELCRRHVAAFEAAVKNGDDLVVACTQEAPLFTRAARGAEGRAARSSSSTSARPPAGRQKRRDATPKIAALLALADLPAPEPVPVVSYRSGGRAPDRRARRRARSPGPSAWRPSSRHRAARPAPRAARSCRPSGATRCGRAAHVDVKGYLGAFEVEWEQANPIDLEACTRCNACIRVCPEQAIDYTYQIDLDACTGPPQVRGGVRRDPGDRFRARRRRAASERFDLVLDLSDRPLFDMSQPPQGYFAPGRRPARAGARRCASWRSSPASSRSRGTSTTTRRSAPTAAPKSSAARAASTCARRAAITSDLAENRVEVEPHLCMGCGGCATVCPSGAMTYAYPRVADIGARLQDRAAGLPRGGRRGRLPPLSQRRRRARADRAPRRGAAKACRRT